LLRVLSAHVTEPAAALTERVFAAVAEHAGDRGRQDDTTLIIVKRETA
jgi:serine phosphatase RsbU (regulator of sigma subunit)